MNNDINYEAIAKSIRQDVYKNMRLLRSQIKEIKDANRERISSGEEPYPTYAIDLYNKMMKKIKQNETAIRDMSLQQLKSVLRQQIYILNLKSSNIKTIESTLKYYKPLQDVLKQTSESTRDKFWSMFSRLGDYGELTDRFKYEIWDTFTEKFKIKNISVEEFEEKVQKLWYDMNKNRKDMSEDEFRISFTAKMHKLFD